MGRVRGTLLSAGIAVGVLVLAGAGGAISGRLQHGPTLHASGTLPPVVTTSTSSTSSLPDNATVSTVRAQIIDDMSLDVQSQRLDPDLNRRVALAASSAAVAARHDDIATAWVPDKVATLESAYDKIVHANALSTEPSVTEGQFVVRAWTSLTINGIHAVAVLTGHYSLTEPTNRNVANGVVNLPDDSWTITVRLVDGRWRLEDRVST